MCGIVGVIGTTADGDIRQMLEVTSHRGEDHQEFQTFDRIGSLGINRLSIIDLARGQQPIYNEDGSIVLVCNGEIYNHRSLRSDLAADHEYRSGSDVEIIVHLYEEYGSDAIKFLDGMFAFILFDLKDGTTFIGRDPLGIKPLAYRMEDDAMYVSSEVKGLINKGSEGVRDVPPGHYWTQAEGFVKYCEPSLKTSIPNTELCRALLSQAVRERMMSDVEVGTFLSGGIDSSIVTALAAQENPNIKAFTVGMKGTPDVAMARKVAAHLGVEHIVQEFTVDDMLELLSEAIYHIESYNPSMVTGAVVTLMASRLATEHGVKVALCGEGADELLGGYSAVRSLSFLDLRRKLDELLQNLHKTELRRLDRMSMAATLEARVPFLDWDFVEYAFNLPSSEKIKEEDGKRIEKWHLRKAFEDLLPAELIWREKMPFDQGSGGRGIITVVEDQIDDEDFVKRAQHYAPWNIQSKEMLHYFEIWKGHFGELLEPGKTFDMFGDYPVLMDKIVERGSGTLSGFRT